MKIGLFHINFNGSYQNRTKQETTTLEFKFLHRCWIILLLQTFSGCGFRSLFALVLMKVKWEAFLIACHVLGSRVWKSVRFANLNPHWHELWKQEKCSSLAPPRGIFYKTQWAWQGVKLTRLMSIFTSKKVWKFLIQIQLTKSNPKITRG